MILFKTLGQANGDRSPVPKDTIIVELPGAVTVGTSQFPNKSWVQSNPSTPSSSYYRFKVGTGSLPYASLPYGSFTDEAAIRSIIDTAIAEIPVPSFITTGTIIVEAGEAMGGHRVAMMRIDKAVYYDPSFTANTGKALGFTQGAVVLGEPATIITNGTVTNQGWGLSPGQPYYAIPSGLITTVAPTLGIVQRVGVALTADTMNIHLSEPYTLI